MQGIKTFLALSLICTSLILGSCDGGRCVKGNRDVITEYRSAEAFSGLISEGSWEVFTHLDSIYYVEVEAESNLLPYISTAVNDNDLILRTRDHRCINNREPIRIHVYGPQLSRARLEGSGDMSIEKLSGSSTRLEIAGSGDVSAHIWSPALDARISGSGEMYLSGEVETGELQISGSGDINAYPLRQDRCFATISGSGDMYLDVATFLDVRILGSGDVHYKGNPQLNVSILGSGEVIHTW
jgi:hypothetical protein